MGVRANVFSRLMQKLWMSSIISVRSLQILYFSKKIKKLKRLKKRRKKARSNPHYPMLLFTFGTERIVGLVFWNGLKDSSETVKNSFNMVEGKIEVCCSKITKIHLKTFTIAVENYSSKFFEIFLPKCSAVLSLEQYS